MIKLRAWDKKRKCYQKLMMLNMEDDEVIFSYKRRVESEPFKDFGVEQYTQVKDINRTEIYENDYVRLVGSILGDDRKLIGVVKMLEGSWMIVNDKLEQAEMLWDETAAIEVIGNIHENVDLLEDK